MGPFLRLVPLESRVVGTKFACQLAAELSRLYSHRHCMVQGLRLVRGSRRGVLVAAFVVVLAAVAPAPASAEIGILGGWGGLGSGNGQFTGASALTIDSAGDVYVVDGSFPTYNRVQKFTPAGAFITSFGNKGSEPDGFYGAGVAAATPSNIYVVDTFNKRIQQYTSTVPPTTYAHAARCRAPVLATASWSGRGG